MSLKVEVVKSGAEDASGRNFWNSILDFHGGRDGCFV